MFIAQLKYLIAMWRYSSKCTLYKKIFDAFELLDLQRKAILETVVQ